MGDEGEEKRGEGGGKRSGWEILGALLNLSLFPPSFWELVVVVPRFGRCCSGMVQVTCARVPPGQYRFSELVKVGG